MLVAERKGEAAVVRVSVCGCFVKDRMVRVFRKGYYSYFVEMILAIGQIEQLQIMSGF